MNLPRFFSRIGWRIFFPFTLLLVTSILSFGVITHHLAQRFLIDNAANELRVLSVILSQQLQKILGGIEADLKAMESNPFLVEQIAGGVPDLILVENFLREKLERLPGFSELAVFNRKGECIGSTDPHWYDVLEGKTLPFFVHGLKQFNFSDIYTSDEGKIQLVSAPIIGSSSVRGVVVGQLNLATVYQLMDEKLGFTDDLTDAFILDSALRFITPGKTGEDRLLESHLISTALIHHLHEEFWVDRYKNYSGDEVLGTVAKIPGRNWYAVVERDLNAVMAPIQKINFTLAIAMFIAVLVVVGISYSLTRSIVSPIVKLVKGVQRIAAGDVQSAIEVPRPVYEIAYLSQEVDRMRSKIAAYQDNLLGKLKESERKRMESERLAAIGTLASSLAHEIRNPLNAMSLLLARLSMGKLERSHSDELIDNIKNEITRLDRLVSEILDYARPLGLNRQKVDLVQLIRSTLEMLSAMFQDRAIQYTLQTELSQLLIDADDARLKQAVINIIKNSLEAVQDGEGQLIVHITDGQEAVKVAVIDNGIGLPQEHQSRLFDLFYTTKQSGTGLGLASVKKIIEAHGGQVNLFRRESIPPHQNYSGPRGTIVQIDFPKASQI
jgi:signal transduction histidine kinase